MDTNDIAKKRIAIWTPWFPQHSGIADYSANLVRHLACLGEYEIEVFVDDACLPLATPVAEYSIYPYSAYEARHAERPFDLAIYHMGNSDIYHEQIYRQLLRHPGITVLHDISLIDFYFMSLSSQALLDEVAYNYGQDTRASMQRMIEQGNAFNHLEITMTRRTVEQSLTTIVHSAWARDYLKARYPASTIVHIPEAAPIQQTEPEQIRVQFGWTAEQFVIGVFGSLHRIKRLHVVIEAFRHLHDSLPDARLVIAGYAGSALEEIRYVKQINAAIRAAGLDDAVHIATNISDEAMAAYIAAVDLVVNLRWPTAGETSASMMHAFGAGKVVITSDVPQVREYDERFCRRVPVIAGELRSATMMNGPELPAPEVECLSKLLVEAATQRDDLAAAGAAAREFMQAQASWEKVARTYSAVIEDTLANQACLPPGNTKDGGRATGVNVIGDVMIADGLGEATRTTLTTIMQRGIPVSYSELPYSFPERYPHYKERFAGLPEGSIYPVNLLMYNLHVLPQIAPKQLQAMTAGKYTVGVWFWELAQIPEQFQPAFERVDEIWVSSRYTQASMLTVAQTPVAVIPCPVEVTTSPRIDRSFFGIPDGRYVFLFSFAATSCNARKNPLGVIHAFERAFGTRNRSGPLLVLKVHFLDYFPVYRQILHEAVERVGGILLEESYTREQMNNLLACADAYISLHRSEGFGLGMAESMYLGKPVIATNYSGNTDFMTPQNSYLVDYHLRLIREDDHAYQPECNDVYQTGKIWAEPNTEQAAAWMWHLYHHQDEGRQRGERAAADIRRHCSPAVVGELIERRLRAIEREQVPLQAHAVVTSMHRQIIQQHLLPSAQSDKLLATYQSAAQAQLQMAESHLGFMAERLDDAMQQDPHLRDKFTSLQASIEQAMGRLEEILLTFDALAAANTPAEQASMEVPTLLEQKLHATLETVDEKLRVHLETIGERLNKHTQTAGEQLQHHLAASDRQLNNHQEAAARQLHESWEILEQQHQDTQARLEPVEELARLHSGQIRYLLDGRRDDESAVHPLAGANLIRLLTLLERDMPELAQAPHAGITIQNGNYAQSTEAMIMLAADFFGERLTHYGQKISVWYHIDYTANRRRAILFENACSKLDTGGWLVIITGSDSTEPVSDHPAEQLAVYRDRIYPVAPGIAVRVCIWKRT